MHKNTNIYVENPFFLKGKTTRQTSNNFTIIRSITIIRVYVSRLKKNFSYFSLLSHTHTHTHTHTQIISFKGGNTLLSPFYFLLHAQLPHGCLLFSLNGSLLAALSSFSFLCSLLFFCSYTYSLCVFSKVAVPYSLLPLAFLPSENPFSLSWFHTLFSISL